MVFGTTQTKLPLSSIFDAMGAPVARLPLLDPYLKVSDTELAVVGVHLMVTDEPASNEPPRGAMIASGPLVCASTGASSAAVAVRMLKNRMLIEKVVFDTKEYCKE